MGHGTVAQVVRVTNVLCFPFQDIAGNCNEFTDYANLIGLNTHCKMRWSGQWPINPSATGAAAAAAVQPLGNMVTSAASGDVQIASMSLSDDDPGAGGSAASASSSSTTSSAMLAAVAAAAVAQGGAGGAGEGTAQLTLATNPSGTLMTIDHQLHQQIQQHLSAEQLDLLNQLQVR